MIKVKLINHFRSVSESHPVQCYLTSFISETTKLKPLCLLKYSMTHSTLFRIGWLMSMELFYIEMKLNQSTYKVMFPCVMLTISVVLTGKNPNLQNSITSNWKFDPPKMTVQISVHYKIFNNEFGNTRRCFTSSIINNVSSEHLLYRKDMNIFIRTWLPRWAWQTTYACGYIRLLLQWKIDNGNLKKERVCRWASN